MPNRRKLNSQKKKHETKNNLHKQDLAEAKLETDYLKLNSEKVPHYLDYHGKTEWERITPLMENLPISELDRSLLVQYCDMYSHYRKLQKYCADNGTTVTEINGAGNEVIKQSPYFKNLLAVQNEIVKLANLLGLSVDSRMRIAIQQTEKATSILDIFKEDDEE